MSPRFIAHIGLTTCLLLSACAQTGMSQPSAAPPHATPAAETLSPTTQEQSLQWAASVVRVDFLPNQGGVTAKLFGLAGGDPAMNGLYTYLAMQSNPHDEW